jgi:predicted dithiol-disulfide oxidoreductase (DUF899 family)
MHRFPNETDEYRVARDELLEAEIALRSQIEAVAAQRRALPIGGVVPQDYAFEALRGGREVVVPLSELFDGRETLLLYNFMFGPDMDHACPMCSSFLDALDGNARHLRERVGLAVVAKSPIERIEHYAKYRGWRHLPLYSSQSTTFNLDYHGEEKGEQESMLHVFVKRDDFIHQFWSSELRLHPPVPGQNPRHIDLLWPLWNALDLTPEGRGSSWYPGR